MTTSIINYQILLCDRIVTFLVQRIVCVIYIVKCSMIIVSNVNLCVRDWANVFNESRVGMYTMPYPIYWIIFILDLVPSYVQTKC